MRQIISACGTYPCRTMRDVQIEVGDGLTLESGRIVFIVADLSYWPAGWDTKHREYRDLEYIGAPTIRVDSDFDQSPLTGGETHEIIDYVNDSAWAHLADMSLYPDLDLDYS